MAGKAFKKFLPLFDRVLVERLTPELKTKSGILLPEKTSGKIVRAKVIATGNGLRDEKGNVVPMNVKVGDDVLLPEYGGTKVLLEETEYHLFRDGDILGKFTD